MSVALWRVAMMAGMLAMLGGCASTPATTATQDTRAFLPALQGDYFPIRSKFTGRDYHIFVRLPEGYDANSGKRYPIIYLLDGDILFPLLASEHLLLHYDEKVPEAIIVGIAYGAFGPGNFRNVDYTVRLAGSPAEYGGAAKFLDFLRNELIPTVEARVQADPQKRVLLGQSLGGNFVLWSAQEAPDLFWARIASNPGAAAGKPEFFAKANPANRRDLQVIVASGSRDTEARRAAARAWVDAWPIGASTPWQVKWMPVENGTHAATVAEVYRRALLEIFKPAAAPDTH